MKHLKLIDSTSLWFGKVSSFLILVTVGTVMVEVISRYGFTRSYMAVFDLVWFFCGVVYMLAAGYTLYLKGHVNIDFVYARLSPRAQAIADAVTFPFFFVFCALLVWQGIIGTADAFKVMETTQTPWGGPVYLIKLMIPLGALVILLQGIAKFARDLSTSIKGGKR